MEFNNARLPEWMCRRHLHIVVLLLFALLQCCACGRRSSGSSQDEAPTTSVPVPERKWDELQIEVTGHEFQWYFRYAGRDCQLGTEDDRITQSKPHLPAHTRTKLVLKSRDYLYTYAIPEFDENEIAVPDMTFTIDLITAEPGEFEYRGDQFCGFSHPQLSGQLIVESAADFSQWLDSLEQPSLIE